LDNSNGIDGAGKKTLDAAFREKNERSSMPRKLPTKKPTRKQKQRSFPMKHVLTLLGVATVGTLMVMRARRHKSKPMGFAGKALMMGGRVALLGMIGYRALRSGTKAVSETMQKAGKESAKAWNSEPSLSVNLK
jgi:hypothetical protein